MEDKNRFSGFANLYDEGRPKLPKKVFDILKKYYRNNISLIVDIGCGTGNSSEICEDYADKVIGIDPSKDMINIAKKKANSKLMFKEGRGDDTGLDSNIADVVICSQAFHWMEPTSTINEVCRILKDAGVFAVVDIDTFPVINLELEKYNSELQEMVQELDIKQDLTIYPTKDHLDNLKKSNRFSYCKEISFENEILYDRETFKNYFMSKGGIQNAIKSNYEPVISKLKDLDSLLDDVFQNRTLTALFSCKIKLGIK